MLIIFENLSGQYVILIKMHTALLVCLQEKVSLTERRWSVIPICALTLGGQSHHYTAWFVESTYSDI